MKSFEILSPIIKQASTESASSRRKHRPTKTARGEERTGTERRKTMPPLLDAVTSSGGKKFKQTLFVELLLYSSLCSLNEQKASKILTRQCHLKEMNLSSPPLCNHQPSSPI